jgi:hypothetical protein
MSSPKVSATSKGVANTVSKRKGAVADTAPTNTIMSQMPQRKRHAAQRGERNDSKPITIRGRAVFAQDSDVPYAQRFEWTMATA